jgi:hypothetical protein
MSAEAIDDGLTRDWGEEFVYRVPQSLVSALAALPPDEVARCAAAWAETEEWRLDAPAAIRTHDLTQLIAELCQLARRAQRDGKAMYVWMSL